MPLRFAYTTPWPAHRNNEFLKADWQLHIVNVASKEDHERILGRLLTEDEYLVFAVSKLPTGFLIVRLPDDWEPPDIDRSFRNAWKFSGSGSTMHVDMPTARNLHRVKLREMREPLLDALDVAYTMADERSDAQAKRDIAAQKQALRDVTAHPSIEAAQTPDELRLAIPPILKGE